MTRYVVNPLCLFLAVWSAATILYLGGVLAGTFRGPQPLTVGALLLNLGTFSLGYLTWSLFRDLAPRSPVPGRRRAGPGTRDAPRGEGEKPRTGEGRSALSPSNLLTFSPSSPASGSAPLLPSQPCTRERVARALRVTLLIGLAALLMELYRIVLVAAHFNLNWLYLVTHPAVLRLRLVLFTDASLFQTSSLVMLLSLANSLFSIGFILLGVFLYLDRTRWKYVYLAAFLLLALAIGLLHMSRYDVTANILYLVFAYCFMHARENAGCVPHTPATRMPEQPVRRPHPTQSLRTSHLKLLIPLAAIALLFVAIDLLLRKSADYAQANRLQGFLFHLYWYIASPLAAFNEFLTTFRGDYTLGQNMFFPLYKWLCRFHLAQPAEVSVYGEKVYLPYLANVYTYLRSFYEDFGLPGVALAPYILGWLTAAVQRRARRYFHFLNLYIILLMLILFSFYNYFLTSNQIYLQILFGFVFFRYNFPES